MRLAFIPAVVGALMLAMPASAGSVSQDSFVFLSTAGALVGAANACGVAKDDAVVLASGVSVAINRGGHGDPAEAFTVYNSGMQGGIERARSGRINCGGIAKLVTNFVHQELAKAKQAGAR